MLGIYLLRSHIIHKCWDSKHSLMCSSKYVGNYIERYETNMGTIAAVALVLGHEVRFMYERSLCKSICARCCMHMSRDHSSLLQLELH